MCLVMKKQTLLASLLLIGLLTACDPISTSESPVTPPNSGDDSGESSSQHGDDNPPAPPHEHVKDDTRWYYDTTKHWHDCTAHDNYHFDEANHTYIDQVVEPTYEAKGYTIHTCSVCGYYYTDNETNKKEHQYSTEWTYNDEEHWHACIDAGYESLKKDVSAHNHSQEQVVEPTEQDNGFTRHTCICGHYYDDDFTDPTGTHNFATTWTYDTHYHWHACLDDGCHAESNKAAHTYGTPVLDDSTKDVANKVKGKYVYTCETCDYSYEEVAYYTAQELCDLMNTYLVGKEYFDVFELRDDLVAHNFPAVSELEADEYFGYDLAHNLVAVSDGDSVTYPAAASYAKFVPFKEETVTDEASLMAAVQSISSGDKLYSSIKLNNNISISHSVVLNSSYPIEINLAGYTLDSVMDNAAAIKVSKANEDKPVVAIKGGTIQTKVINGYDMEKSPSCVTLIEAESLRISNVTLNNRAERGYAYIDFPDYRYTTRVKINDSTINSKIVGICIQTNENLIDHNTINAAIVINGGSTMISNNTVDVTNIQEGLDKEATELITAQYLYEACKDYYIDRGYNTYMVTATDAILIYDRRSESGTYSNPEVVIDNNVLKCKLGDDNVTPYGYGVRYMDLKFDNSLAHNSYDLGIIDIKDNNEYSYCLEASAYQAAGGYLVWEADD